VSVKFVFDLLTCISNVLIEVSINMLKVTSEKATSKP
jgi:hypothetical protein